MNKVTVLLFIIFFIPINALIAQEDIEIIEISEDNSPKDIPFAIIENVPVYPGCTGENNNELRKCTSAKITAFVNKKFRTNKASKDLPLGIHRIFVSFKLDKTGVITNIKVRTPSPALKKEALRVIKKLPKLKPGYHKGKNVDVLYSLPITFNLEE